MQSGIQKARRSCDACAFRRVKCSGDVPCADCRRRSIECTRLRERRKRGPKGLRQSTVQRICEHKQSLGLLTPDSPPAALPSPATSTEYEPPVRQTLTGSYQDAFATYHAHLDIFRRRLSSVWPIVNAYELKERLIHHPDDWESQALAAALCAAVIAQLRLDRCPEPDIVSNPQVFVTEAERLRQQHTYLESVSLDSLLTSFFLHIYYSNVQKLSTASYLLRETVTTAHILRVHEPKTYDTLDKQLFQRRLRIFWTLFISERTFCAQNDLPPILHPITEIPAFEEVDAADASSTIGFVALTQLFVYLETDFFCCKSPGPGIVNDQDSIKKISNFQRQLQTCTSFPGISETQYVDLNVTRHWIRSIIWRYTSMYLAQSSQSRDPALAITYPIQIARESLELLSNVSIESIRAHGYGMELKVLRLANSLLDILTCLPELKSAAVTSGWRDTLCAMGNVLQTVGGHNSHFAALLKQRIQEIGLDTSPIRELAVPILPHLPPGAELAQIEAAVEVDETFEDLKPIGLVNS